MSSPTHRRSRRLAGLAGILGAAVLLVAGKAATAPRPGDASLALPRTAQPSAPAAGTTDGPPGADPAPAAEPPTTAQAPAAAGGAVTVLGQPEDVHYGTVQVRVTLAAGHITDVQAVHLPSGGRSSEIAAYAAPRLRTEVLAAQSATIDMISGATYTSEGYAQSVQSALDAAPR